MKEKKVFGLRFKIMLPVLIINVLVCVVLGVLIYRNVYNEMIERGRANATTAAKLASRLIVPEDMKAVAEKLEICPEYERIMSVIRYLQEETEIAEVYTFAKRGEDFYYTASSSDGDGSEFENMTQMYPEYLSDAEKAYTMDMFCTDKIERSKFGVLMTVYQSIYTEDGERVGVIGVDFDVSAIMEYMNRLIVIILVTAVALCMVSALILILLINKILSGIKNVQSKMEELLSNHGDLTRRIEITSGDEVGQIGRLLNHLLAYIQNIIRDISEITGSVEGSMNTIGEETDKSVVEVEEVSGTMQQMSAMMQETCASLAQIEETTQGMMNEVSNVYKRVEESQKKTREISKEAVSIYENVQKETEDARIRTGEITDSVRAGIEQAESVSKIGELSEKILDIADQTSLLSLNASIEAARAGEAGRGFAVVAEQISQLSALSASTAGEIQQISSVVITSVNNLADKSEQMIRFVSEKTMGSYEKLQEISQDYNQSAQDIYKDYSALEQNMKRLEQDMDAIRRVTREVDAAVDENTKGITQITEIALRLNEQIMANKKVVEENEGDVARLREEVDKFIVE